MTTCCSMEMFETRNPASETSARAASQPTISIFGEISPTLSMPRSRHMAMSSGNVCITELRLFTERRGCTGTRAGT